MSGDNNNDRRKRTFDVFNENYGNASQFPTDYLYNDNNNNNNEGDTGTSDFLDAGEPGNATFSLRDSDGLQNVEAPFSHQDALPETGPGMQPQAPLTLHLAGQNPAVTDTVAPGTGNMAAQGTEPPQGDEAQERPAKRPRRRRDELPQGEGQARPPKRPRRRRDEPEPDYSQLVRERLRRDRQRENARTGQACDRCKERKMKCDTRPEGCSMCATRRLDCKVTDPITGETYIRGELQRLRRRCDELQNHLAAALDELQYYRNAFNGRQPSQAPSGNFQYDNLNPFQMPPAPPVPTYPMRPPDAMMDPTPGRPSGSDTYGGQQQPFVPYPRRPMTPVHQPPFPPLTQHPRPDPRYGGIGPHRPSISGSPNTQNPQTPSQSPSLFAYGPGIPNRAPSRGGYRPRVPAGDQGNQNNTVTPSSSMSGLENTQYLSRGTGVPNTLPRIEITRPPADAQGQERRPQYINPLQTRSSSSSDYAPTQLQPVNRQGSVPFTPENGRNYQDHQSYRRREEYQPSGIPSQRPSSLFDSDRGLQNRPQSTGAGAGRPPTARDERESESESQPPRPSVTPTTTVRVPGGIPGTDLYVAPDTVNWRGPSPYVTERNNNNNSNSRNQGRQPQRGGGATTQPPAPSSSSSSSPPRPSIPPFSDKQQEEPREGNFSTGLEPNEGRGPAFPRFSAHSDGFPLGPQDQQQQQQQQQQEQQQEPQQQQQQQQQQGGRSHSSTNPEGDKGNKRPWSSDPDPFDESDPFRDTCDDAWWRSR
ncbi:hypothetical protein VTN02DRAFT_6422 [Thermoascus thermophilus]